jgi:hypothetical protein
MSKTTGSFKHVKSLDIIDVENQKHVEMGLRQVVLYKIAHIMYVIQFWVLWDTCLASTKLQPVCTHVATSGSPNEFS